MKPKVQSREGILTETNENFRKILGYVGVKKMIQKSSLLSEYYTNTNIILYNKKKNPNIFL